MERGISSERLGQIHQGDCIAGMNSLPEGSVDLVFADPPFNIGYEYDVYEDRMAAEDYLKWSNKWLAAVYRTLKPTGTFWLAIGDDFAAELKLEAQKVGFYPRSWVIWYYTFGVNCKFKFTRSHTHLFYFVKDHKRFTFRSDDLKNRVPSARSLVYGDKRASGEGRLPDDTWIIPPVSDVDIDHREVSSDSESAAPETFILRPQELEKQFRPEEDTWYIPRVAGTFKERAGFHGCQMPEQLLGRIIRCCSEPGEVVMDPFAGSASTLVVARKLGRQLIGFELSPEYTRDGQARIDTTSIGDQLDGSPEPTMEAFATDCRQRSSTNQSKRQNSKSFAHRTADEIAAKDQDRLLGKNGQVEAGIVTAFQNTSGGFSTDVVLADPDLNQRFADECIRLGLPGSPRLWNQTLLRMRKRSGATGLQATRRFGLSFVECEPFLYASEIAWKTLISMDAAVSLDEILCDPHLAGRFDKIARDFAPNFSSLQYRWGALRIRKVANSARRSAAAFRSAAPSRLGQKLPISDGIAAGLPAGPGIYMISENDTTLFISGAINVSRRIQNLFEDDRRTLWTAYPESLFVQYFQTTDRSQELVGWTSCFLQRRKTLPKFNIADLRSAT